MEAGSFSNKKLHLEYQVSVSYLGLLLGGNLKVPAFGIWLLWVSKQLGG